MKFKNKKDPLEDPITCKFIQIGKTFKARINNIPTCRKNKNELFARSEKTFLSQGKERV